MSMFTGAARHYLTDTLYTFTCSMTASCSCSAGQEAVNAIIEAHCLPIQSHTPMHSNMSTFSVAVLEKTDAGNVACQGTKDVHAKFWLGITICFFL